MCKFKVYNVLFWYIYILWYVIWLPLYQYLSHYILLSKFTILCIRFQWLIYYSLQVCTLKQHQFYPPTSHTLITTILFCFFMSLTYSWTTESQATQFLNEQRKERPGWWSRRMQAHFLPWTHQKYIYMWNNSHWKQTRELQKDSCTTKAVRKIHVNQGGREKKRSGQDLCPWEGTKKIVVGTLHRQRSSPESEKLEPHMGQPSSGVQHWEDESP